MTFHPARLLPLLHDRLAHLLVPVIGVVVMLVLLAAFSFNVLSSLRAFVNAESMWSKAQKNAVAELRVYLASANEQAYQNFLDQLVVPQGDLTARLALDRDRANTSEAAVGFAAGRSHADDIDGMIWLYRYFKNAPHVARAVDFWNQADALILQLRMLGSRLHTLRTANPNDPLRLGLVGELDRLDAAFGPLEEGFSAALGDASRLTLHLLSVLICLIGLGLLGLTAGLFRHLTNQSEQSRSELALSEERLRLGFEGTNCGLWDWDMVTGRVFYSPWIIKLLEYENHTMRDLEAHFIEMVHPDDRATIIAAGRTHVLLGVAYDVEFRIRTMTGRYLWVRSRAEAVRDAHGRAIRMVGSIFDISELKEAGRQTHIQRELAQVTLAAIADAVIRTDLQGRIDYCNAVAEALLGRTFGAVRGHLLTHVLQIYDSGERGARVDVITPVLSGATPVFDNANLYLEREGTGRVAIDVSVAAMRDQAGQSFGTVVILHDVSAERSHATQLSHQASHDELTGLLNRREFERRLEALLALDKAALAGHAVMYLDLDQLKVVNDSGGHAAGDQLIRQTGALLEKHLRDDDVLARLGGDEFGVILKHCRADEALRVADAMRALIFDTRFIWEGKPYPVGLSIGLVSEIGQFASLSDLMKVADAACYMAKEKGRNRVHSYHPDDLDLSLRHREIEWVARIGDALDHHRFRLYAQRIVPAASQSTSLQHVELLLRMVDADGNLVPPMSFIPAAERYNLMPKIDRWVVEAAFAMLAAGRAGGVDMAAVTCAINLSGASIEDDTFLTFVLEQQRRHDITLSAICFEITETAAIANLPNAASFIGQLRTLGCQFSLDDFGSGMSSFSYLKHLPVNFLKIDGSFVKDMMHNAIDRAMVEAINQIGHVMGKKTIAEFVEDDATFAALKAIGVDYAQGYGIARPEPFHPYFLLTPPPVKAAAISATLATPTPPLRRSLASVHRLP